MQFHPNSFIGKMMRELKGLIEYNPKKVGEFEFSCRLPPKLCHMQEAPSKEAMINDGIGMTLLFLSTRYPNATELQELMDIFFREDEITPVVYAKIVVSAAQAIIPHQRFGEKNNFFLLEPSLCDFGSKKIYFSLLSTVVKLSFNYIVGSEESEKYFEERKESWKQFADLASKQKTEFISVH